MLYSSHMTTKKTTTKQPVRAKKTIVKRDAGQAIESDGTYLLKLVVCVLLGMFWLRFSSTIVWGSFHVSALPVGFLIGLLLVWRLEKFQSDRKIWYAVLVIVTIISYFFPTGLII